MEEPHLTELAFRTQTRRERYDAKKSVPRLPIDIACINFGKEPNILFSYRLAACYGASNIHVIGNSEFGTRETRARSGTTYDLTNVIFHKDPQSFIEYCRNDDIKMVALELPEDKDIITHRLHEYEFDLNSRCVIIGGHETAGCDMQILRASDVVHIETLGPAYCLNVTQALNAALYEYTRQYMKGK
jgi:tRNA G18 (ribose-2'-O)-methylase SpoU